MSQDDSGGKGSSSEDEKADKADTAKQDGGVVTAPAEIPPTRKQEVVAALEPPEPPEPPEPARPSASKLDLHAPVTYPDDGPFSAMVRKIDVWIGRGEQVVLMSLFAVIVVVAAAHAIADRLFHVQIHIKDDVIRGGTFALAMLAGAFATHQARHLSMDLISRRLSPRNRLFLKVFLALFMIGIVSLLIRAGFHTIGAEKEIAAGRSDGDSGFINPVRIAYTIPLGGGLVILHTFLHALIDIDYLRRRKVPPERMRSGH
ncbi:MAG: TRAP transporter small permease [Deltaproteobacteria bacterium]|nr:TRAP transporter small permease [Deltaproteobacteria bacterium]